MDVWSFTVVNNTFVLDKNKEIEIEDFDLTFQQVCFLPDKQYDTLRIISGADLEYLFSLVKNLMTKSLNYASTESSVYVYGISKNYSVQTTTTDDRNCVLILTVVS